MKLSKVALWPEQDSAVGFYRILQPGRFMKRLGLAEEVRTIPFSGWGQAAYRKYSDKTFMSICEGAEVLYTTLLWKQEDILKCLNLRQHYGLKWVVDIDDNIFAAASDNPAADTAALLHKNREMCLRLADGLTVSVPSLKELYAPYNTTIFVQPNGLDLKMFPKKEVKKKGTVRIGWRGAYGHKQDLALIEPVLKELRKTYDFDFVTFGYDPGFADEYHPWQPFFKEYRKGKELHEKAQYYETLSDLNIDIAVVPLIDSAYNRCKSTIAWQEWSALATPTVYSPIENQLDLPGIPARSSFEWYAALENLLQSETLRRSVGDAQWIYVLEHCTMDSLTEPLATWLHDLPRRTDIDPDPS